MSSRLAQEPDRPSNLDTVLARREALSRLIEERARIPSGDDVALVRVLNQITTVNLKLYDLDSALITTNESLQLARRLDPSTEGVLIVDTLALSAFVQIRRDKNAIAVDLLTEALDLSHKLSYRRGEAQSLLHLGTAYSNLSKRDLAEECLAQALPIWREIQDKQGEGSTLIAQGELYIIQDAAHAATALRQAEAIWRSVGNSLDLAATLLDLNFLAIRQGQWESALALLDEARKLVTDKEAEPLLAGQIAMSLGEVYEAYGQLQLALTYFRESLQHYDQGAHDFAFAFDARNKVGRVMARLGDFAGAKETIEKNLLLAQEKDLQDYLRIGLLHEDLGRVYLTAEQYEQARLELLTAIDYFTKNKDQRAWARAQSYLGQTEYLLGNLTTADQAYRRALKVFKDIGPDYTNEAALCFGIGKLALQQGKLKLAEPYLLRSIELTERLRENAASKDLRSSFLASVHDRYETYVEYLMALHVQRPHDGLHIKALEVSESGRARALLDSLANYQREIRQPTDPHLFKDEAKLQEEEQKLVDLKSRFVSGGNGPEAIAAIDKQLADVRSRYETLQARINSNSKFADLFRPTTLSYESIKAQITDADSSLVEFSLGTGKSFAWVITRDGVTVKELPNKAIIISAARDMIGLLNNPEIDPGYEDRLQASIDKVSRLVWEPLSSQLQTSRLIIVPDGILHYIPFQILSASTNTKEQLIDKFEIVNIPSASTLALVRQQRKDRQAGARLLVGFGDPRFSADNPPRAATESNQRWFVARGSDSSDLTKLPRLFYSKRELRAIQELAGNESEFYLEYSATRNNLLRADLGAFRILHLVTHGVFDAAQPDLSGLILSRVDAQGQPLDGFVGLADIYKLRAPLDLVVLSACHSALGTEVRGEGRVGLTRGFMYAGASSVVASLWKVDDAAGAELMKQFYANMLQRGMRPSAALRAAQMSIRQQPLWRSPYFWAGFTFEGDYDQQIIRTSPIVSGRNNIVSKGAALALLLAGMAMAYLFWRWRHATRS